jgi:hypothetical protein
MIFIVLFLPSSAAAVGLRRFVLGELNIMIDFSAAVADDDDDEWNCCKTLFMSKIYLCL